MFLFLLEHACESPVCDIRPCCVIDSCSVHLFLLYLLAEYKQSIESNLSDTLGISKPPLLNGPILYEEKDERTITPDVTPRAR